jgi:hypothetical protein
MKLNGTIVIRSVLGAAFIVFAILKLKSGLPSRPELTIYARFVNGSPLRHFGFSLMEMALGAWLLSGVWMEVGAIVACIVLSAFTGLIVAELFQAHPQSCGCFGGSIATPVQIVHSLWIGIGRNCLMMFAAAWLFCRSASIKTSAAGVRPVIARCEADFEIFNRIAHLGFPFHYHVEYRLSVDQ